MRLETLALSYQALFAASETVSREEFEAFGQVIRPAVMNMIQALYAPRIRADQRPAFEAHLAELGIHPPRIMQHDQQGGFLVSPKRPWYYPTLYAVGTTRGLNRSPLGIELLRSEERRVGKEGRSRWTAAHYNKKKVTTPMATNNGTTR